MNNFAKHFTPCLPAIMALSLASPALAQEWDILQVDGVCATGTPYQAYTKTGDSDDLVIFFNGGGACWFGQQCDLNAEPVTHLPFAQMEENNPENFGGIFDFTNENNPLANASFVVLPYCTGDLHIGAGAQDYSYMAADGSPVELVVQHNGAANAAAVLSWVYANFEAPKNVIVTGVSAGGVSYSRKLVTD